MSKFEEEILRRLQTIEEKVEAYLNPLKSLAIAEKAQVMRKARATGDKKTIKEASRQINGDDAWSHNIRYKRLMEDAKPAEGYVFKNRVFREGGVLEGEFYFMWGSTLRSASVERVKMLRYID